MVNFWTILLAVAVFGAIILVHELGHFFAARLFRVQVAEFSVGMGPAVFKKKWGDTLFALRVVPVGGYIQMDGEDEESENPNAFCNQKAWKRLIIISAGAIMNLILGLAVSAWMVSARGYVGTTQVLRFEEGAVSSQMLQIGDSIYSVNGTRTRIDNDIVYALLRDDDGLVDMTVIRDGKKVPIQVPFQTSEMDGERVIVLDFKVLAEKHTFFNTIKYSFGWTVSMVRQVWLSLFDLITGRYGFNQLSGPVGTAQAIGKASTHGLASLLMMSGFITVNLGVFNLLPLPALDGGRLIFLILEMIRRRPVSPKYEGYVHMAGLLLLMTLMVAVTYQDILRLVAK